jgi:hypothetical protein
VRPPGFAHASEAELARILDYYEVRWEYEPRTFPILWNLDGKVVESFTPDFFLPDLELFVELTTLKQSLVRRKNRKLRRLRELYPDVRIKLFYAKDFKALMLKYGRIDLAASLSGQEGQTRPAAVVDGPLLEVSDAPTEPERVPLAHGVVEAPVAVVAGTPAARRTRRRSRRRSARLTDA